MTAPPPPSPPPPPPHSRAAARWSADRAGVRTGEGGKPSSLIAGRRPGVRVWKASWKIWEGGGGPLISAGAADPTRNFKMERGGGADEKPACWTGRRGGPDGR